MKHSKITTILSICLALLGCSDNETWYCRIDGDAMYSISEAGAIGSADKGCSCQEMRAFEQRAFGSVDEQALNSDFGC